MAGTYPWAGYEATSGTRFQFSSSERPVEDSLWRKEPKRDRHANLGSARDSIRTLAIGSSVRSVEMWMEPERFAALEGLLGTVGTFTDWQRPVPDSRTVYLESVTPSDEAGFVCTDNDEKRKVLVRIGLLSQ